MMEPLRTGDDDSPDGDEDNTETQEAVKEYLNECFNDLRL